MKVEREAVRAALSVGSQLRARLGLSSLALGGRSPAVGVLGKGKGRVSPGRRGWDRDPGCFVSGTMDGEFFVLILISRSHSHFYSL